MKSTYSEIKESKNSIINNESSFRKKLQTSYFTPVPVSFSNIRHSSVQKKRSNLARPSVQKGISIKKNRPTTSLQVDVDQGFSSSNMIRGNNSVSFLDHE